MFRKRPNLGFTLIEILIVIFIIGLTLGFMTVNYHNRSNSKGSIEASEILNTLAYQFSLAKQEAIVNQRKVIFNLKNQGYGFSFVNTNSELFSAKFDEGVPVKVETTEVGETITLYPNGEITPFKITIDQQSVYVTPSGKIVYDKGVKKKNE